MAIGAGERVLAALGRIAPGLPRLVRYDARADFRHDLAAGLSVAAVAVPAAIANARLAGFDPVVGLYASILPPIAYALFGTSRQLIVGPDTATSAMVAAALLPLAGGDAATYQTLSVALAFLTGLMCIGASFLRLGALADFLSRPILIGFLNGVAMSILFSQLGSLFGFSIRSGGIVPRLIEFASRLSETHLPTLALGAVTFVVLLAGRRFRLVLPAALLAMIVAGTAVAALDLEAFGVAVLGALAQGLPTLRVPTIALDLVPTLVSDAAGLALVLFASGMLSARAFAVKNHYDLDVDREFAAFGAANIAAAAIHGFAVTGSTSRTAVADEAGGRTQVTGLVSAVAVLAVVLFLTEPLRYVPMAALGAILVFAAFQIVDVATLRWMWRVDRTEVVLAMVTTLGVVAVGPINAILVVVALALGRFVKISARPRDAVLGKVPGLRGWHALDRHPDAIAWPGIVIYRFDGPITFFNAAFFRQCAMRAAAGAGPGLQWFVLDMIPVSHVDVTGAYALQELRQDLERLGARLILAGRKAEILDWLRDAGLYRPAHEDTVFSTLREAVRTCRQRSDPGEDGPPGE